MTGARSRLRTSYSLDGVSHVPTSASEDGAKVQTFRDMAKKNMLKRLNRGLKRLNRGLKRKHDKPLRGAKPRRGYAHKRIIAYEGRTCRAFLHL